MSTDSPRLAGVVESLLGRYASDPNRAANNPSHAKNPFELHLRYGRPDTLRPDRATMRKFWAGLLPGGLEMTYYTAPALRLVDLPGKCGMRLDLNARLADLVVVPGGEWALAEGCLMPMLTEVMGLFGQHVVHAACLAGREEDGSAAIILAGTSGRGKTTTALALARSGMEMLTDDATFVVDRGAGTALAAWGLARPCKILDRTFELLGWLADLPHKPGRQRGEHVIEFPPTSRPDRLVAPRVILLLEGPNPQGHRIGPIDKVSAVRVMASEAVRAFEQAAASDGRAFRALARLVGQCKTFSLSAGPDLQSLPEMIAELF